MVPLVSHAAGLDPDDGVYMGGQVSTTLFLLACPMLGAGQGNGNVLCLPKPLMFLSSRTGMPWRSSSSALVSLLACRTWVRPSCSGEGVGAIAAVGRARGRRPRQLGHVVSALPSLGVAIFDWYVCEYLGEAETGVWQMGYLAAALKRSFHDIFPGVGLMQELGKKSGAASWATWVAV